MTSRGILHPAAAQAALAILAVAVATIAGAWIFQAAGFAPCELCLKERIPYYTAIPLALAAFLVLRAEKRAAGMFLLLGLTLVLSVSVAMGVYHSGVEFGFWPGPTDCTGAYTAAPSQQDFLKQLQNIQVVRCDQVALRVLGLSLAAWNALISAGLVVVSSIGLCARK